MIILAHLKAILKNPYFYLEPYLHQIITLILSIILMENTTHTIDLMIHIKDYAIQLLKILYQKYLYII
jgi:hypothetical protein